MLFFIIISGRGSSSKTTNNKNTNTSKDGNTGDDTSDSTSTEFISTSVGGSGGRSRRNTFLNDVRSSSGSRDGGSADLHVGDRVGLRVDASGREERKDLRVTALEARGDEGTRDGVAVDGSRSDGDVIGRETKSLGDILLESSVEAGTRNFLNLGRASSTTSSSSSSLNTSNEVEGVNTDPPRANTVIHSVGVGVEDVATNL